MLALLTTNDLYEVLKETFPQQNDFEASTYVDELHELEVFGITTKQNLIGVLNKHKENVLTIDASELKCERNLARYMQDYGPEYMQDKINNNYWFSYTGLLRLVMELEFDEMYEDYQLKIEQFNHSTDPDAII